ncbi:hypothetical protein PNEG_00767 [Pneumocystis murina B123]|uniref:Rab-GAP TBC domain-containing protein n=1 Tax=Pneumocystis murina (strain B123) TaxID=1069680 RepID=M7NR25_PNEMU|nr:hypothetical protein PNEG_00767 [Pneumocystis murina B123]EMR11173.1 hypothetical protein PNEG_00767 [Pneumocystis murina B123]
MKESCIHKVPQVLQGEHPLVSASNDRQDSLQTLKKLNIFEKIQEKSLKRHSFQGSKTSSDIRFEKEGIKSINDLYSGFTSNHTFQVSSFNEEFGLIPENIYLEDDDFLKKLIDRYGAINFIRLLSRDLALKDLEMIKNQRQLKNCEIVLKKILLNVGMSYLDIDKLLYESFEKTREFLFMNNGDHMVSDTNYMKSYNGKLNDLILDDDASKRRKIRLPVYNKVSSYLFKTMGAGKLRKNIDTNDQKKSKHIFPDDYDEDAFNIMKCGNNYPLSLIDKFYFKGLTNSKEVHINSKPQSYSSSFNKIIPRMALFDSLGSFESFLKMPRFGSYFKEKTRFPRYPHTTHFKSISMAACYVLLYQNSSRSFLYKKKISSMVVEFAWRLVFPLVLDYHQHLIQDYISKSKLKITSLNLGTILSKYFKELNIDHTNSKTFSVNCLYEKITKLKSKTGYYSKSSLNKLTSDTCSHDQNTSQSDQSDTHSSPIIRETATPTFATTSRSHLFSNSVPRPLEMDTIVPPERQPPTLLPSWNEYYGVDEKPLADRFGFIYNFSSKIKNFDSKLAEPLEANNKNNCNQSENFDYLEHIDFSKNKRNDEFKLSDISSLKNDSLTTPTSSLHKIMNMENIPLNHNAISSATLTTLNNDNSIAQGFITLDLDKKSKSFAAKFLLRSQLDICGDNKTKQELWDSFLRKVQNEKKRDINPNFHGYEGSELIGISELGIAGKVGKQRWKEFRNLVIGGIPIIYRPKIWGECSGAYQLHQPGYYNDLLTLGKDIDPLVVVQIDMDVYRTMPNNVFFGGKGPGVPKLKNVLLAFSRHNTQIGYCQGMNVIAAMLLLTHATEEDAFYVLVSIVENILPPYYFTPDLLASRADQRVLTRYVSELCPRIHNHFKKLSVDLEAVTFNWFLTVFTDCLSPEVLFRVFDLLFIEGNVYLFRVSIAIIKNKEKQILACTSPASVYSLLKNLSSEPFNIDSFIRETYENKKQIRIKDVMRLRDIEIRKLKLEIENAKLQEAVNKS